MRGPRCRRPRRRRRPTGSALLPTTSRGRSSNSGRYASSSDSSTRSCAAAGCAADQRRAEVEEDDEHPRPLDVAQELVPEAAAARGALDEAGDVGHDELGAVVCPADADDAEMRLQRGERVVRHLRLGRRHRRDERRLARVGEPDERDVRHQLELEVEPVLAAGLALLGEGGAAPAVRQEARVAPPPLAALGHPKARPGGRHVDHHVAGAAAHDGADRQRHLDVLAPRAVALLPRPVPAVGGAAEGVVLEAEERRLVLSGDEPDVAAVPAVAAVGAAAIDVRLAPERDRAGAAVARGACSWA